MCGMSTENIISLAVSIGSFIVVFLNHYCMTFSRPKLRWLTPMTYSLQDETGERRPTIAIALSIHNSGARLDIIEDVAVRVTCQEPYRRGVAFQATRIGKDLRYVRVPEIEAQSSPMRPLVVEGRGTSKFVIAFEQRSRETWTWSPGRYKVDVYEGKSDKQWCARVSFSFVLTEEAIVVNPANASTQVVPCQCWTYEALHRRDEFCESVQKHP
jgi:hypothetical protein